MKSKKKTQMYGTAALALALATALLSAQSLLADDDNNDMDYAYSGAAVGIYLNNLPMTNPSPVIVAQAGPLPASGGKDDADADHVELDNDAVTCDHADAHVEGHDRHSESHAHASHFHIQFTGSDGSVNTVDADDVEAHVKAEWHPGDDHDTDVAGGDDSVEADENGNFHLESEVHVHGLVVNGEKIDIKDNHENSDNDAEDDDDDAVLNFPGFTLIINHIDQSESDDEGQAAATGIRIMVSGSVYANVGKAEADLVAEEEGESDVVTGSGTFTAANGDNDIFSFTGGTGGGLVFSDQKAGVNVVSTGAATITQVNATTEQLVYPCLINGVAGTATCVVQDVGGLFGAGDTFSISLSTGFTASGSLSSGEVVLLN